jgi:hypothetical protein
MTVFGQTDRLREKAEKVLYCEKTKKEAAQSCRAGLFLFL